MFESFPKEIAAVHKCEGMAEKRGSLQDDSAISSKKAVSGRFFNSMLNCVNNDQSIHEDTLKKTGPCIAITVKRERQEQQTSVADAQSGLMTANLEQNDGVQKVNAELLRKDAIISGLKSTIKSLTDTIATDTECQKLTQQKLLDNHPTVKALREQISRHKTTIAIFEAGHSTFRTRLQGNDMAIQSLEARNATMVEDMQSLNLRVLNESQRVECLQAKLKEADMAKNAVAEKHRATKRKLQEMLDSCDA